MTDSATQLTRIIQMVAVLSRLERDGAPAVPLRDLAARLGVSPDDVERDVRTLTAVNESAEHDWLGSLSVLQEGDALAIASRGPFRRPIRLTPDEVLAIQISLAEADAAAPLSRALAELLPAADAAVPVIAIESAGPDEGRVVDLARHAARERCCVEIQYAGSGATEPARRVIEIHRIVLAGGRFYLVAWCRTAGGPRRFRADRVLDARLLPAIFAPRPELAAAGPDDVYATDAEADRVTVRFAPRVARWVAEQFPDAAREADGSLTVDYSVSDPAWLVRTVLQFGPDAEVVAPAAYRSLVLAVCAGD